MLDDFHGLLAGIEAAEGQLAGAASALAFLAFLVEFVRGRAPARSFRPLIGWLVVLLGVLAAASAAHALTARRSPPWAAGNWVLSSTLLVGALMVVAGALAVLLAPSQHRARVWRIAAAVEASVRQPDFANYVSLAFHQRTGAAWLAESRIAMLRRLDVRKLPTASVTVVAGPANSGKSFETGYLVVDVCARAQQRNRPRDLAVHVSAHRLPAIDGPITVDTVREHVLASVAQDDTALRAVVEEYLDSGAGPRWLFTFDLGTELSREQEEQYFEAVRNFMAHRDHDRALVVVREEFPDAGMVLMPQPPDLPVLNKLLQRQGVKSRVKPPLAEWKLAPAFADPALIAQFGPQLVDADRKSVRDIVETFVAEQLGRRTALGTPGGSPRERAEEIAYRILVDGGGLEGPVSDVDATPLRAAGLVRVDHGAFAFRYPIVGVHLAAGHLTRAYETVPLAALLRTETTRAVLLTALHCGDEPFVRYVVGQIETLIGEWVQLPEDGRAATALPPLGTFQWPEALKQALTVVADLDRLGVVTTFGAGHVALIDHLLWLAVLGGGLRDREVALTLLVLASPERILELYRQTVSLGYDARTTATIATIVRLDPAPTLKELLALVSRALEAWEKGILPLQNAPADGRGFLRPVLDKVVSAARAYYFVSAALLLLSVVTAPSLAAVAFGIGLASMLGAAAALMRTRAVAVPNRARRLPRGMVLLAAWVAPLFTVLSVPKLVLDVARLDLGGVLGDAFFLLFWSWPLFTAAMILRDPGGVPSWWFPHRIVADLIRERTELRGYATAVLARLEHLRSPWRWAALGVIAAVGACLAIDLPLSADVEQVVDGVVAFVLVVATVFVVVRRPRHARRGEVDVVRARIFDRSMTEEALLAEFSERAEHGYAEFSQLLSMLAAAQPGALEKCVHVLQALDGLLEFFERTLPEPDASSTARIKPDLWRYAPEAEPVELRKWAEETDRARPGLLLRLAQSNADRIRLATAIEKSKSEIASEVPRFT